MQCRDAVTATAAVMVACFVAQPTSADSGQDRIAFFEKKVRPLLVENCYDCHSQTSEEVGGGLYLDSRAGWERGGDLGPVIVPGSPDESRLLHAVKYVDPELQMPPVGKLNEEEILALAEWIEHGANDPRTEAPPPKLLEQIDYEVGRRHWAFQQPVNSPAPVLVDASRVHDPLDAFVQARLEAEGLPPSPEANRSTLIRRVTHDLIGLLPTPAEVRAFDEDRSPLAYENLVDRLLGSPHFGEKWSRHWLDLARYGADQTTGNDQPSAWRYRDWVTRAFNEDMPYDRFVALQLAADHLEATPKEDWLALGFLGLGRQFTTASEAPKKQLLADEWDDSIDVLSQAFLGLTVACARCHDHKFDPISTEDYYALAGVFASTTFAKLDLSNGSVVDRYEERRKEKEEAEKRKKEQEARKKKEEAEKKKLAKAEGAKSAKKPAAQKKQVKDPEVKRPPPAIAHVVADVKLEDVPIFRRGNPEAPGEVVRRRFLTVFSPDGPKPFEHGSGRLELAERIANDRNPLTARVFVNRVWGHCFGEPIVKTPSNFGQLGTLPTHPKLLDHLTVRFVEEGWSLKRLLRRLTLSATYRQVSRGNSANEKRDPDNQLLWRANRKRLSVETWRDCVLQASRLLDARLSGPSVDGAASAEHRRRTLYTKISRRKGDSMLALFDFPRPTVSVGHRAKTTTSLQQLFLLNDAFMRHQADAFADRVLASPLRTDEQRLREAYEILFSRAPTTDELESLLAFVKPDRTSPEKPWALLAHTLFMSNEMRYVE